MKKKIFIACDVSSVKMAKKIIAQTQTNKLDIVYKFGFQFFYSKDGRKFISKLKDKKIFLDLKLNDIPNTCASAIKSLKDLNNILYLTVHVSGGLEMLKVIKKTAKKFNKKLNILGVTVLTSLTNTSIKKIGHTKSINHIVRKQASLAKLAGLDGIVCSGHEVKFLKKIYKNLKIVTPGIRIQNDKVSDQKRVMTPREAFKNGAYAIVMGRSITKGNIKKNINRLINSLQ
tara:strand:- start:687 stop:1376 length:690 start_codon:yes stop_codon:yes gene_type:complete